MTGVSIMKIAPFRYVLCQIESKLRVRQLYIILFEVFQLRTLGVVKLIKYISFDRFDIGPVLHQKTFPIHPHIRTPELTKCLGKLGAVALQEVLVDLDSFLLKALPQNEMDSSLSPKVIPEMGNIQWESQSATTIYNLFRGLSGSFKLKANYLGRSIDFDDFALFSAEENQITTSGRPNPNFNSNQCQIIDDIDSSTDFSNYYDSPATVHIKSLPNSSQLSPGHIFYTDNILCVKCRSSDDEDTKQNWIFIRKVKIGTKWMSAKDFRNGFLTKKGAATRFESISPSKLISNRAIS